ncbi:MAG TPA: YdcF family protein [Candidatus Nanopelagicales bacterium]|nr:YdcF family protein [Candidatus Nanopelagicales bacterium]
MPRALSVDGRRSVGRTLAAVAVVGVAGALAVIGYATFRIWQRGDVDDAPRVATADAIVVLGAAQYDGSPSPVFRARLDHAIALWREGRAPLLVMTGGRRAGDRTTEAATARDYAIGQGVPAASIRMEDQGRSTLESLRAVATILERGGLGSAFFVSDRSHMLRVLRMARDLGIEGYGSPAPDSPMDATVARRVDATLHELGALAWYALTGRPAPEAAVNGS